MVGVDVFIESLFQLKQNSRMRGYLRAMPFGIVKFKQWMFAEEVR